jgi:hypothetical protein
MSGYVYISIKNGIVDVEEYFVHMCVISSCAVYMELLQYVHLSTLLGYFYYIHRVIYITVSMHVVQYVLGVCRSV